MAKKKQKISKQKKAELLREALKKGNEFVPAPSGKDFLERLKPPQNPRRKKNRNQDSPSLQIRIELIRFFLITASLILALVALFIYSRNGNFLDTFSRRLTQWLNI